MGFGEWLRKLFGRNYHPASPPQPGLTAEEAEQRREQIASGPDDPKLTPSEEGDGPG
jgi:hypothetical protein